MDKEASWIKQYWRPAIAWQYFAVCLFDFIVAPIMLVFYAYLTKTTLILWNPLTLAQGGFYHLSMGAIIGVAAWSRGQEKMQKIINGDGSVTIEKESSSTTQTGGK